MMHQKMIKHVNALVLYMLTWTSGAFQQQPFNFTEMKPTTSPGSLFIFHVIGNVYPLGYYAVAIRIGKQPTPFLLDIDTGSDLTWVTCDSAKPTPRNLYNVLLGTEFVKCQDRACTALGDLRKDTQNECKAKSLDKQHPCDYTIGYADGTSSSGFLVKDTFPLKFSNGKWVNPGLLFGVVYRVNYFTQMVNYSYADGELLCGRCGRFQHDDPMRQLIRDGILGLSKANSGILNQLSNMGVIQNVVGHCFSEKGGGYLFFGDVPIFGIVWKQIDRYAQHYSLGSADILFAGQVTDIRGLHIFFDSGSTYTYLNSRAYEALLDLIKRNLNKNLMHAPEDGHFPLCWKGAGPFKSFDDVTGYFWTLALSFTGVGNVKFQLYPRSYLIITNKGNVCLGILNGGEIGLGDLNIIGDISMHDKLVIYDNKRGNVGWAEADCNVLIKVLNNTF